MLELQDLLDRQSREQTQMKERLATLSSRVAELEEDLDTARKDLIKSEEANSRLQRDVREVRGGCLALPVLSKGVGPPTRVCSVTEPCSTSQGHSGRRGLHADPEPHALPTILLGQVPLWGPLGPSQTHP